MKILFATDGSDISYFALDNATTFLKDCVIDVLCVIDWNFYPTYIYNPEFEFSAIYEKIANDILNQVSITIKKKGFILGKVEKVFGVASEEIIKKSKSESYDLVVLGSHGKKGVQSWLGSVSRQVVLNVKEPVFISKQKETAKKIVVALDGSDCSYNALKTTIELFDLSDSKLYICYVMEDISTLPVEITSNEAWLNDILVKQRKHASDIFDEAKNLIEKNKFKLEDEILLSGNPAKELIKLSEVKDISLMVMGSHSYNIISEIMIGSTSKRVLENVKNSVMLISCNK